MVSSARVRLAVLTQAILSLPLCNWVNSLVMGLGWDGLLAWAEPAARLPYLVAGTRVTGMEQSIAAWKGSQLLQ